MQGKRRPLLDVGDQDGRVRAVDQVSASVHDNQSRYTEVSTRMPREWPRTGMLPQDVERKLDPFVEQFHRVEVRKDVGDVGGVVQRDILEAPNLERLGEPPKDIDAGPRSDVFEVLVVGDLDPPPEERLGQAAHATRSEAGTAESSPSRAVVVLTVGRVGSEFVEDREEDFVGELGQHDGTWVLWSRGMLNWAEEGWRTRSLVDHAT